MPGVLCDNGKSVMKCSCPYQQVRERNRNATRSLPARDRARTLGNLVNERMHGHRRTKVSQKSFPPLALFRGLSPLYSVRELDDSHRR